MLTSDDINALPDALRMYIHDLETRCDPAGDIRELRLAKDEIEQLRAKVAALAAELECVLRAVGIAEQWLLDNPNTVVEEQANQST